MTKRSFCNLNLPIAGSVMAHGIFYLLLGATVAIELPSPEKKSIPVKFVQATEAIKPETLEEPLSPPPPAQEAKLPSSLTPPSPEEVEPPPDSVSPQAVPETKETVFTEEHPREKEETITEAVFEEISPVTVPLTREAEPETSHAETMKDPLPKTALPEIPVKIQESPSPETMTTQSIHEMEGEHEKKQEDEMIIFRKMVQKEIEKAKFYPLFARRRGYEGAVGVSFAIQPDGNVNQVTVTAPCHCEILNKAACNAVKKAAPFLPRPSILEDREINMEINVAYELR